MQFPTSGVAMGGAAIGAAIGVGVGTNEGEATGQYIKLQDGQRVGHEQAEETSVSRPQAYP